MLDIQSMILTQRVMVLKIFRERPKGNVPVNATLIPDTVNNEETVTHHVCYSCSMTVLSQYPFLETQLKKSIFFLHTVVHVYK